MSFDSKKLRKDLEEECMGAFFAGGRESVAEKAEIENASPTELGRIANRMGINPDDYDDEEDDE